MKCLNNKKLQIKLLITDSRYRQHFSSAVLRLQEKGVLDDLKRKWWKEERKEAQCEVCISIAHIYNFGVLSEIYFCRVGLHLTL